METSLKHGRNAVIYCERPWDFTFFVLGSVARCKTEHDSILMIVRRVLAVKKRLGYRRASLAATDCRVVGRPVGVAVAADGSLYISDDRGYLFRVTYGR